jgi:hypothetical protein
MATEPVQYKMIRFCDMTAERGKVYRYRIKLYVEDPNNPNVDPTRGIVHQPPQRRTLSEEVLKRLTAQQEDEKMKSWYWVETEWSEPTEPVSIPSPSRVFAGSVSSPRMSGGVDNTLVQQSEVEGEIVPVVWNEKLAIDVSKAMKVSRGAVLNAKDDFEVLDPISLVLKVLKEYPLRSNYLVADMMGGEDLPGDRESRVSSAGEFAIFDDNGNLVVHNELDDYERYRRFTFADEVKPMTSDYGSEGDYGSGSGMPGSGPGMGPGMPGSGPAMPGGRRGS